ncbi:hypothetical protein NM688_g4822 [Phlebia brevispora]|uniref:Uncharacterized protein n=1 Tax=Phlebia brevispora TaxID=194682 RepID=A0ACC1T1S9_9APHY|nr:hypothetical protein NM688_g4822 [Phlebia brevispora]
MEFLQLNDLKEEAEGQMSIETQASDGANLQTHTAGFYAAFPGGSPSVSQAFLHPTSSYGNVPYADYALCMNLYRRLYDAPSPLDRPLLQQCSVYPSTTATAVDVDPAFFPCGTSGTIYPPQTSLGAGQLSQSGVASWLTLPIRQTTADADEVDQTYLALEKDYTTLHSTPDIMRLPRPILIELFMYCAADVPERYPYRWLRLTQVCRSWRNAAFSCPQLWTTVVPTCREAVALLLRLSQDLPLTLKFGGMTIHDDPELVELYKIILADLPRIRDASILVSAQVSRLLGTLNTPLKAHTLETLRISFTNETKVVPALVDMVLPRLKSLTMWNATDDTLDPFIHSTLTSLELNRCSVPLDRLIDMLTNLPGLRELRLQDMAKDSFPSGPPFHSLPEPSQVAFFPHLTYLLLLEHGDGVCSAHLLNHISIPDETELHFCTRRACHPRVARNLVFPSIKAKLHTASKRKIPMRPQSIYISTPFYIRLWLNEQSLEDLDWHESQKSYKMTIDQAIEDYPWVVGQMLSEFMNGIDLTDVRTMHVDAPPFPRSIWTRTFAAMTELEELTLSGASMNRAFAKGSVLSAGRRIPADAQFQCIFPALKVLKLFEVKMKRQRNRQDSYDRLEYLIDMLAWRMVMCGRPLQRLILEKPINLSSEDHGRLVDHEGLEQVVVIPVEAIDDRYSTGDKDEKAFLESDGSDAFDSGSEEGWSSGSDSDDN